MSSRPFVLQKGARGPSSNIVVRVTDTVHAQITRLAKEHDLNMSDATRQMIEFALGRMSRPKATPSKVQAKN